MADTGTLGHADDLDGAVLKLYGTSTGSRTLRVAAGPKQHLSSAGHVSAYCATEADGIEVGSPVAVLQGTPARAGELSLRALDAGRLKETVVIVGGDEHAEGTFVMTSARHDFSRIQLGFDEEGPYLGVATGFAASVIRPGAKAFVEKHPRLSGMSLHYCALEGPEAAVYIRGTLELTSGRGEATLPEHFALVTTPDSMTVQLTARARESRGLCATVLTPSKLVVEELLEGRGSYRVDYLIHGIHSGHEGYQVVRPTKWGVDGPWSSGRGPEPASSGDGDGIG